MWLHNHPKAPKREYNAQWLVCCRGRQLRPSWKPRTIIHSVVATRELRNPRFFFVFNSLQVFPRCRHFFGALNNNNVTVPTWVGCLLCGLGKNKRVYYHKNRSRLWIGRQLLTTHVAWSPNQSTSTRWDFQEPTLTHFWSTDIIYPVKEKVWRKVKYFWETSNRKPTIFTGRVI